MKIAPRTVRLGLLGAGLLLLAGCACIPLFGNCCRLIEFKPSSNISNEKWREIAAVLHRSDPSLYRIVYYKDGVLQKRHRAAEGTLPENELRRGLAGEVAAEAKASHYTGHALQAGYGNSSTHQTVQGTSSTKQVVERGAGNSSTHPTAQECQPTIDLVNALEAILQGYHR